jgi:hypothetical protein
MSREALAAIWSGLNKPIHFQFDLIEYIVRLKDFIEGIPYMSREALVGFSGVA